MSSIVLQIVQDPCDYQCNHKCPNKGMQEFQCQKNEMTELEIIADFEDEGRFHESTNAGVL